MDLFMILVIIFIPLLASLYVKSTYNNYSKIEANIKLSGSEVARKILDKNGLKDMHIVKTRGNMTDHYDPRRKVVRLSEEVFDNSSISSIAIAAHEVGHAIQDKNKYIYMNIRSAIFPIVKITSSISYYVILIGFMTELLNLIRLGIGLVLIGFLFQVITLPVEFNASKIAKTELNKIFKLNNEEKDGVSNMLTSAALTYLAGVLASAIQLLRLVLSIDRRD